MDKLRVRVYNVRFGDAILLTIPDRNTAGVVEQRHILIDVGNVFAGEGGDDTVFAKVLEDILLDLNGQPLDLYINTHEHMDHVQGLLMAATQRFGAGQEQQLLQQLHTQYAWLTASSDPTYYAQHPKSKQKKLEIEEEIYPALKQLLEIEALDAQNGLQSMMLNNNPRSTKDCVRFLRTLAPPERTFYVHRQTAELSQKHPFQEVHLELWGPEEDTAVYYGRFHPAALALGQVAAEQGVVTSALPVPPPGVDVSAFYNLLRARQGSFFDNLLAIDKAANNTSIVLYLEWRGWKLLFPGDAELESWQIMHEQGLIKPVHFLKISHHASYNGTPDETILEKLLPQAPEDARIRSAIACTLPGVYQGIPHAPALSRLKQRCGLVARTMDSPERLYVDFEFAENGEFNSTATPYQEH